jgi:hypothetical protein
LHFCASASFRKDSSHPDATAGSPDPVNTSVWKQNRSGVADVPDTLSARWNGQHDDAQREHRQSHEFEYQSVGRCNSLSKPIDLSGND